MCDMLIHSNVDCVLMPESDKKCFKSVMTNYISALLQVLLRQRGSYVIFT